jgi:hypothetical protein
MRKTNSQKLKPAKLRFLRSVKRCTRINKIRNEDIRKEPEVFLMNDRIRRYIQDQLEHVEETEEERM